MPYRQIASVIAVALLCAPALALAAEFRAGEQTSFAQGESTSDDLYLAGGSVRSAGAAQADLVAVGGTVVVNSVVGADLAAAGGNVTLLSRVADDARLAGGSVMIEGSVGGDLLVGGGQISVGGSGIAGDVAIGGGSIRVEAPVGGDVRLGGGEIYINAPIKGSVRIYGAEKVSLGSAAVIGGNLEYSAREEAEIAEGARVNGETIYTPLKTKGLEKTAGAIGIAAFTALFFGKFLALLACAFAIGIVFRRYAVETARAVKENPLLEMGRGFAVAALLPLASVILLVTLIGAPLGFLGLLATVSAYLWGWIIAPIVLGSLIFGWFGKRGDIEASVKTILIGVIVYTLLGLIPIVGWLAKLAIFLAAFGAAMHIKWRVAKEWR